MSINKSVCFRLGSQGRSRWEESQTLKKLPVSCPLLSQCIVESII